MSDQNNREKPSGRLSDSLIVLIVLAFLGGLICWFVLYKPEVVWPMG